MSKWEWKKLGEVCSVKCGATPLKSDKSFWERGTVPWFTVDDIHEQGRVINSTKKAVTEKALKKLTLFPKKTVLLCCTASVGEYAISNIEVTCNQQFNGLIVRDKNYLDPNYLFHFASTLKEKLLSVSGKTTIDFISNSKVCDIDIPIPPLSEQKRIVKFLDEEFSKIETLKTNAETNLKNAKELFETTLEKELNPLSRHSERSEESSAELPSGWELKALGDVCYRIKRGKAPKYVEQSDVLVFAQKCNQPDGTMSLEKALCLDPSILGKYKAEDYVKEGDVLVNSTGNGTVGRVGFFNNKLLNNKKTVVPDTHITTIRGLANTFPKYLYYFLKPKESYLSDKSLGTTNMKELHADVLEHLQIPLPPLSVQKEIVARLDKLSENVKRLEANYKQIIADCDELKKSILKKTFEGES